MSLFRLVGQGFIILYKTKNCSRDGGGVFLFFIRKVCVRAMEIIAFYS